MIWGSRKKLLGEPGIYGLSVRADEAEARVHALEAALGDIRAEVVAVRARLDIDMHGVASSYMRSTDALATAERAMAMVQRKRKPLVAKADK